MSKTPVKIISLGLSQSNFLNQLYGLLKKEIPALSFHVDRYRDLSKGAIVEETSVFEGHHDFSKEQFSKIALIGTLIKLGFMPVFWKYLFFEIGNAKSIKDVFVSIKNQAIYKHIATHIMLPKGFDVFHIHFCTPYNLRYVPYLQNKATIICSFWGSDLYRNPGKRNVFYVSDALERASVVTIQTPEMGAHLFEKYGSKFKDNLVYAQFAIEPKIYELIDAAKNDVAAISNYKSQWNIPEKSVVIAIGYNANEAFRHIEILKVINRLPSELVENVTCLLSLTYQRDDEYIATLKTFIDTIDRFSIVTIDAFLTHEKVAMVRLMTDIQIQMPVSDALSGSVTEALYAESIVIAGKWLPYDIFGRANVSLLSVEDYDDLESLLTKVLPDVGRVRKKNKLNPVGIKEHFFPKATMAAWTELYKELLP